MEFEAHILMAHPDEGHRFEGGPRREKEWKPSRPLSWLLADTHDLSGCGNRINNG